MRASEHQVSRCWYPDADLELIDMANGSMVAVLVGEPAYQLSSGEIILL